MPEQADKIDRPHDIYTEWFSERAAEIARIVIAKQDEAIKQLLEAEGVKNKGPLSILDCRDLMDKINELGYEMTIEEHSSAGFDWEPGLIRKTTITLTKYDKEKDVREEVGKKDIYFIARLE